MPSSEALAEFLEKPQYASGLSLTRISDGVYQVRLAGADLETLPPNVGSSISTPIHDVDDQINSLAKQGKIDEALAIARELEADLAAVAPDARDLGDLNEKWADRLGVREALEQGLDRQYLLPFQVPQALEVVRRNIARLEARQVPERSLTEDIVTGLGLLAEIVLNRSQEKDRYGVGLLMRGLDVEDQAFGGALRRALTAALSRTGESGKVKLLVVGAGAGKLIFDLRKDFPDVEPVFVNRRPINVTEQEFAANSQGEITADQAREFLGYFRDRQVAHDADKRFKFGDQEFDIVLVGSLTAMYIQEKAGLIAECKRMTKAGGAVFVNDLMGFSVEGMTSQEFFNGLNRVSSPMAYKYAGTAQRPTLTITGNDPAIVFPGLKKVKVTKEGRPGRIKYQVIYRINDNNQNPQPALIARLTGGQAAERNAPSRYATGQAGNVIPAATGLQESRINPTQERGIPTLGGASSSNPERRDSDFPGLPRGADLPAGRQAPPGVEEKGGIDLSRPNFRVEKMPDGTTMIIRSDGTSFSIEDFGGFSFQFTAVRRSRQLARQ
jgi:hypothetical protein